MFDPKYEYQPCYIDDVKSCDCRPSKVAIVIDDMD